MSPPPSIVLQNDKFSVKFNFRFLPGLGSTEDVLKMNFLFGDETWPDDNDENIPVLTFPPDSILDFKHLKIREVEVLGGCLDLSTHKSEKSRYQGVAWILSIKKSEKLENVKRACFSPVTSTSPQNSPSGHYRPNLH